jgi:hypothetical protein
MKDRPESVSKYEGELIMCHGADNSADRESHIAAGSAQPKTQLNPDDVQRILVQQPIFIHAMELVLVPWQAMAAIWYRESFSVEPNTPGGPFQFDPPAPPDSELRAMLARYVTTLNSNDIELLVDAGVNDFSSACIFAACHLRDGAKYNLSVDHSDQAIKDAFYGYNGRAYGPSPDDSPYVMNNFDKAHMDMRIIGTELDGHGVRIHVDAVDLRPGAFTVYKQLLLTDNETQLPK